MRHAVPRLAVIASMALASGTSVPRKMSTVFLSDFLSFQITSIRAILPFSDCSFVSSNTTEPGLRRDGYLPPSGSTTESVGESKLSLPVYISAFT